MRRPLRLLVLAFAGLAALAPPAPAQERARPRPREDAFPIDLDHILHGRINGQGQLVGMHHAPSAPKSMRAQGIACAVEFLPTSPGGRDDVTTARVVLRDPQSRRIVLEKTSTLYPAAWSAEQIEAAIREAYADAKARDRIEPNGRWEGRTKGGVRLDGYLRYDRKGIATAFPVYTARRGERRP